MVSLRPPHSTFICTKFAHSTRTPPDTCLLYDEYPCRLATPPVAARASKRGKHVDTVLEPIEQKFVGVGTRQCCERVGRMPHRLFSGHWTHATAFTYFITFYPCTSYVFFVFPRLVYCLKVPTWNFPMCRGGQAPTPHALRTSLRCLART